MLRRIFDLRMSLFLAVLFLITVLVPLGNAVAQPGSGLHVPSFMVTLMGRYLCYALLAVALDLVWGYCGILSLGHGAFFALGGYAMGMHLMREIGDRGAYANPLLPDFMVFLGYDRLPWYWLGFDMFWFALLMTMLVPGLLAFVFGWFAFRSRVTGVYLSIMTQALTFALMLAFARNEMSMGGTNGLTDFRDVLGFSLSAPATRNALFVLTCIALALGLIVGRLITTSKTGKVLVAVRDAESRTRFLGYKVESYKLFVFTVSAMLAGLAGALYVPQVGFITPGEFSPANSIEIVVWVALGGRGTLIGAAIGAVIVAALKSYLTANHPDAWLFVLGALFILVTIAMPRGVLGMLESGLAQLKGRGGAGPGSEPDPGPEPASARNRSKGGASPITPRPATASAEGRT